MMHALNASIVELVWERVLSGLFRTHIALYTGRSNGHASPVGHHSIPPSHINPFAFLAGPVDRRSYHDGDALMIYGHTARRQSFSFNPGVTK